MTLWLRLCFRWQGVQVLFLSGNGDPTCSQKKKWVSYSQFGMVLSSTIKEGDETCLGNSVLPEEHAVGTTVACDSRSFLFSMWSQEGTQVPVSEDSADSEAEPRPAGTESAF